MSSSKKTSTRRSLPPLGSSPGKVSSGEDAVNRFPLDRSKTKASSTSGGGSTIMAGGKRFHMMKKNDRDALANQLAMKNLMHSKHIASTPSDIHIPELDSSEPTRDTAMVEYLKDLTLYEGSKATFAHCGITEQDLLLMERILVTHPTVESLDVTGNYLSEHACVVILQILRKNKNITEVLLPSDAPEQYHAEIMNVAASNAEKKLAEERRKAKRTKLRLEKEMAELLKTMLAQIEGSEQNSRADAKQAEKMDRDSLLAFHKRREKEILTEIRRQERRERRKQLIAELEADEAYWREYMAELEHRELLALKELDASLTYILVDREQGAIRVDMKNDEKIGWVMARRAEKARLEKERRQRQQVVDEEAFQRALFSREESDPWPSFYEREQIERLEAEEAAKDRLDRERREEATRKRQEEIAAEKRDKERREQLRKEQELLERQARQRQALDTEEKIKREGVVKVLTSVSSTFSTTQAGLLKFLTQKKKLEARLVQLFQLCREESKLSFIPFQQLLQAEKKSCQGDFTSRPIVPMVYLLSDHPTKAYHSPHLSVEPPRLSWEDEVKKTFEATKAAMKETESTRLKLLSQFQAEIAALHAPSASSRPTSGASPTKSGPPGVFTPEKRVSPHPESTTSNSGTNGRNSLALSMEESRSSSLGASTSLAGGGALSLQLEAKYLKLEILEEAVIDVSHSVTSQLPDLEKVVSEKTKVFSMDLSLSVRRIPSTDLYGAMRNDHHHHNQATTQRDGGREGSAGSHREHAGAQWNTIERLTFDADFNPNSTASSDVRCSVASIGCCRAREQKEVSLHSTSRGPVPQAWTAALEREHVNKALFLRKRAFHNTDEDPEENNTSSDDEIGQEVDSHNGDVEENQEVDDALHPLPETPAELNQHQGGSSVLEATKRPLSATRQYPNSPGKKQSVRFGSASGRSKTIASAQKYDNGNTDRLVDYSLSGNQCEFVAGTETTPVRFPQIQNLLSSAEVSVLFRDREKHHGKRTKHDLEGDLLVVSLGVTAHTYVSQLTPDYGITKSIHFKHDHLLMLTLPPLYVPDSTRFLTYAPGTAPEAFPLLRQTKCTMPGLVVHRSPPSGEAKLEEAATSNGSECFTWAGRTGWTSIRSSGGGASSGASFSNVVSSSSTPQGVPLLQPGGYSSHSHSAETTQQHLLQQFPGIFIQRPSVTTGFSGWEIFITLESLDSDDRLCFASREDVCWLEESLAEDGVTTMQKISINPSGYEAVCLAEVTSGTTVLTSNTLVKKGGRRERDTVNQRDDADEDGAPSTRQEAGRTVALKIVAPNARVDWIKLLLSSFHFHNIDPSPQSTIAIRRCVVELSPSHSNEIFGAELDGGAKTILRMPSAAVLKKRRDDHQEAISVDDDDDNACDVDETEAAVLWPTHKFSVDIRLLPTTEAPSSNALYWPSGPSSLGSTIPKADSHVKYSVLVADRRTPSSNALEQPTHSISLFERPKLCIRPEMAANLEREFTASVFKAADDENGGASLVRNLVLNLSLDTLHEERILFFDQERFFASFRGFSHQGNSRPSSSSSSRRKSTSQRRPSSLLDPGANSFLGGGGSVIGDGTPTTTTSANANASSQSSIKESWSVEEVSRDSGHGFTLLRCITATTTTKDNNNTQEESMSSSVPTASSVTTKHPIASFSAGSVTSKNEVEIKIHLTSPETGLPLYDEGLPDIETKLLPLIDALTRSLVVRLTPSTKSNPEQRAALFSSAKLELFLLNEKAKKFSQAIHKHSFSVSWCRSEEEQEEVCSKNSLIPSKRLSCSSQTPSFLVRVPKEGVMLPLIPLLHPDSSVGAAAHSNKDASQPAEQTDAPEQYSPRSRRVAESLEDNGWSSATIFMNWKRMEKDDDNEEQSTSSSGKSTFLVNRPQTTINAGRPSSSPLPGVPFRVGFIASRLRDQNRLVISQDLPSGGGTASGSSVHASIAEFDLDPVPLSKNDQQTTTAAAAQQDDEVSQKKSGSESSSSAYESQESLEEDVSFALAEESSGIYAGRHSLLWDGAKIGELAFHHSSFSTTASNSSSGGDIASCSVSLLCAQPLDLSVVLDAILSRLVVGSQGYSGSVRKFNPKPVACLFSFTVVKNLADTSPLTLLKTFSIKPCNSLPLVSGLLGGLATTHSEKDSNGFGSSNSSSSSPSEVSEKAQVESKGTDNPLQVEHHPSSERRKTHHDEDEKEGSSSYKYGASAFSDGVNSSSALNAPPPEDLAKSDGGSTAAGEAEPSSSEAQEFGLSRVVQDSSTMEKCRSFDLPVSTLHSSSGKSAIFTAIPLFPFDRELLLKPQQDHQQLPLLTKAPKVLDSSVLPYCDGGSLTIEVSRAFTSQGVINDGEPLHSPSPSILIFNPDRCVSQKRSWMLEGSSLVLLRKDRSTPHAEDDAMEDDSPPVPLCTIRSREATKIEIDFPVHSPPVATCDALNEILCCLELRVPHPACRPTAETESYFANITLQEPTNALGYSGVFEIKMNPASLAVKLTGGGASSAGGIRDQMKELTQRQMSEGGFGGKINLFADVEVLAPASAYYHQGTDLRLELFIPHTLLRPAQQQQSALWSLDVKSKDWILSHEGSAIQSTRVAGAAVPLAYVHTVNNFKWNTSTNSSSGSGLVVVIELNPFTSSYDLQDVRSLLQCLCLVLPSSSSSPAAQHQSISSTQVSSDFATSGGGPAAFADDDILPPSATEHVDGLAATERESEKTPSSSSSISVGLIFVASNLSVSQVILSL